MIMEYLELLGQTLFVVCRWYGLTMMVLEGSELRVLVLLAVAGPSRLAKLALERLGLPGPPPVCRP
jgi:hypothetical protein